METIFYEPHDASIRRTLLKTKTFHPFHQMVVPGTQRLLETVQTAAELDQLTKEITAALWQTEVHVPIES